MPNLTRTVLDLVPPQESEEAARVRADKRNWLEGRGYRLIELKAAEVEADVPGTLDRIDVALASGQTAT